MKLIDALNKGDERLDGGCARDLLVTRRSPEGNPEFVGCAYGAIAVGLLTDSEWDLITHVVSTSGFSAPYQLTLRNLVNKALGNTGIYETIDRALESVGRDAYGTGIVSFNDGPADGNRDQVRGFIHGKGVADVEITR